MAGFDYLSYVVNDVYNNFSHFLPYLIGWFCCLTTLAIDGTIAEMRREKQLRRQLLTVLNSEEMSLEKAEAIEDMFLIGGDRRTARFIRKHEKDLPSLFD